MKSTWTLFTDMLVWVRPQQRASLKDLNNAHTLFFLSTRFTLIKPHVQHYNIASEGVVHCDYGAVTQRLLDAAGIFMAFLIMDGNNAEMNAQDTDLITK